MTSIRDTIQQKKPCHMLRALSAYDPQRTGSLTAEALGTACSSIFGVSDEDQQKIIAKLDPNGTGSVRIIDFVSAFEYLDPLGSQSDPRIWSPWQDRSGVAMTAYNWERVAPPLLNLSPLALDTAGRNPLRLKMNLPCLVRQNLLLGGVVVKQSPRCPLMSEWLHIQRILTRFLNLSA